jgi:hypothetical protein
VRLCTNIATAIYRKISDADERRIIQAKLHGRYRSARVVRFIKAGIPSGKHTAGLSQASPGTNEPASVKPIRRFRAAEDNDFWQIDIQGNVHFRSRAQRSLR